MKSVFNNYLLFCSFLCSSQTIRGKVLREGLAWHYKHFDQSGEFAQAEHLAKQHKKGLWVQGNAIPPWEYRRRNH